MTKYVKFISKDAIEYPPINKGSVMNYNLDTKALIADGYKSLIEAKKPTGEYKIIYEETKNSIKEVIVLPTPVEIRLNQIDGELAQADLIFAMASQAPLEFENHIYKFEWTTLYQGILDIMNDTETKLIWDITELEANAVTMNKTKLQELQNILVAVQEPAFQARKSTRSALLTEKQSLLTQLQDAGV